MNLHEDLFKNLIPFQVGNIVEVTKERDITYGRIDEVTGRFKDDVLGKSIDIYYKINNVLIPHGNVTRRVSER